METSLNGRICSQRGLILSFKSSSIWYGNHFYHIKWPPFNVTIFTHVRNCVLELRQCEDCLTLFRPIEFAIKLHTIKSECSILHIEGSQVIIPKTYCILFSEDQFVVGNSADANEIPPNVEFHQGLHRSKKYPLSSFCPQKVHQLWDFAVFGNS